MTNFNPRTPDGVRHCFAPCPYYQGKISIHAPLTGCDDRKFCREYFMLIFQSTHP